MKTNFNTDEIKVVLHRLMFAVTTFIKWLACSVVCGVVLGLIGTFFINYWDWSRYSAKQTHGFYSDCRLPDC